MPLTNRTQYLLWAVISAVFLLALACMVLFYYYEPITASLSSYYDILTDKEKIQGFLKAVGPLAPVFFILIQTLQVVFAPVPGEATGFIGGFLFGVPLGLVYSTIGLTLGSILAFLIARWLEEHYVARWIPPEILRKFDFLMERQGALIAFILFIFPGFPKDYLCFVLGLSHMPFKLFLVIVTLGRIPGTLLLTLQGAQVYKGNYYTTLIILGLCLVLMSVLSYYRETLYAWMKRFDHPEEDDAPEK